MWTEPFCRGGNLSAVLIGKFWSEIDWHVLGQDLIGEIGQGLLSLVKLPNFRVGVGLQQDKGGARRGSVVIGVQKRSSHLPELRLCW